MKIGFNFPVNARDLYDAARIGTAFSTWIGARLRSNGYELEQDYITVRGFSQRAHCERTEYFISFDAAYTIAGNMRGEARRDRAQAHLDRLSRRPTRGAMPLVVSKDGQMFTL